MKTARPGESLSVAPFEEFALERDDAGPSGYRTVVEPPPGVVHVDTECSSGGGFGAGMRVVDRFRCEFAGRFRIRIVEGRPWEDGETRSYLTIDCG